MSVGFPQNKGDIDSRLGSLTVALRNCLRDWLVLKDELDAITDSDLVSKGYSSDDVALIRSAYNDMADFAGVYAGSASSHLTGTYDYRTFTKRLTGVV